MNRWISTLALMVVSVVGLLYLTAGAAAEPVQKTRSETTSSGTPDIRIISPQENDRRIARWLAVDNRVVLGCAQMAKDRTTNPEIRTLADELIAEHQNCLDKLQAISKETGKADDSKTRNEDGSLKFTDTTADKSRTATLIKDEGESRDNKLLYQPTDFLALKETVCNSMKDVAKQEWEGVSAEEFDRAFLKHQFFAHQMLISTIKTVRGDASQGMQDTLTQGLDKYTSHLERIKNLLAHHPAKVTATDKTTSEK